MRTYSLAEVAAAVLPPEMKNPQLWLVRRLRRGEIQGYKVGRYWRMTAQDVDALVASLRNVPNPGPHTDLGENPLGLTRRSWLYRQRYGIEGNPNLRRPKRKRSTATTDDA
jgi:hypothetical protein